MKKIIIGFLIILPVFAVSCGSNPETVAEQPPKETVEIITEKPAEKAPEPVPEPKPVPEPEEKEPEPVPEPNKEIIEEIFDPANVSEEVYISTRDDVRNFISELNQIIRREDYASWRAALSQEHIDELSSHENLARASELLRVNLRSLEDYFRRVVVPSRANVSDNVDNIDIEFLSEYRVKAFTLTPTRTGELHPVQLYDLEKINDSWIIIK